MRTKNRWKIGLLTGVLLASAVGLRADSLTVALDETTVTVAQGTTSVTLDGTITNPSATDTIYLNGDNSNTVSNQLSVDDTPFLTGAPLFLAPGQNSGDIRLFTVNLDPLLAPGSNAGNVFSILGGPDGGAGTDFGDLVDIPFTVVVQPPTTEVPEPSSAFLVFSAFVFALLLRISRS